MCDDGNDQPALSNCLLECMCLTRLRLRAGGRRRFVGMVRRVLSLS